MSSSMLYKSGFVTKSVVAVFSHAMEVGLVLSVVTTGKATVLIEPLNITDRVGCRESSSSARREDSFTILPKNEKASLSVCYPTSSKYTGCPIKFQPTFQNSVLKSKHQIGSNMLARTCWGTQ